MKKQKSTEDTGRKQIRQKSCFMKNRNELKLNSLCQTKRLKIMIKIRDLIALDKQDLAELLAELVVDDSPTEEKSCEIISREKLIKLGILKTVEMDKNGIFLYKLIKGGYVIGSIFTAPYWRQKDKGIAKQMFCELSERTTKLEATIETLRTYIDLY